MFAFLIVLAIICALGAIVGAIALYRTYHHHGISRKSFTIALIAIIIALGGSVASALSAHALEPSQAPATISADDVPEEERIPDVDLLVDLNQVVIDDLFGDYSRYVLRSSWPSMSETRSHYTGFSDAVSLPMTVDQAWFDAAMGWGPHGQTVTNPDGTTSTISSYDDINAALKSRQSYLDGLSDQELFSYYRQQIYNEILRNPIYGDMVARFFLEDELITTNNEEWLREFVDKMDEAYSTEGKDDDDPMGIECWVQYDPEHTGDDRNQYLMTTDEYYQYAARLCLVLGYYTDEGVSAPTADEHYCLPPQAEITSLRTEKADYSESKDAFILVYKTKDGSIADRFGFNLFDRRIERPKPDEPQSETPDTPTPDTPTPDQPTPDIPTPDRPTPTPTTPAKDPADDPAQQGNADIGGGANQPSDGTGDRQDYEAEREQNQDYRPSNNTGDRGDNGTSHETVTDANGGHTDNGTPPSNKPDSPEHAAPATGTETTVTNNGDGTTTTTTTEADASEETADGVLPMPD